MNVITKEFLKTEESIYNLSKRLNISSEELNFFTNFIKLSSRRIFLDAIIIMKMRKHIL